MLCSWIKHKVTLLFKRTVKFYWPPPPTYMSTGSVGSKVSPITFKALKQKLLLNELWGQSRQQHSPQRPPTLRRDQISSQCSLKHKLQRILIVWFLNRKKGRLLIKGVINSTLFSNWHADKADILLIQNLRWPG